MVQGCLGRTGKDVIHHSTSFRVNKAATLPGMIFKIRGILSCQISSYDPHLTEREFLGSDLLFFDLNQVVVSFPVK
jgi:hypothetical protein